MNDAVTGHIPNAGSDSEALEAEIQAEIKRLLEVERLDLDHPRVMELAERLLENWFSWLDDDDEDESTA